MERPNQLKRQLQYTSYHYRMIMNLVFTILLVCLSGVNGQVPTRAPNFGNLPCSICPQSTDVVTSPDTVIPGGTLDFVAADISCDSLSNDALAAYFRPSQCKIIIESTVPTLCGCETPAVPTSVETGTPSITPVAAPVPVAVPAPVPVPVTVPAPVPVPAPEPVAVPVPVAVPAPVPVAITNATIVTSVSITLSNVVSTLNTPDLIAIYNSVVSTFLGGILSSDTVQNLTATLINQNLVLGNSSNTTRVRRLGTSSATVRRLQSSDNSSSAVLFPLQTDANVTAIVPSTLITDSGIELFTNAIVSAVATNASDLIKVFQAADPAFFGTVTAVESSPTPTVPVPVPVPTPVAAPVETPVEAPVPASTSAPTSGDKGISGGAIAGIVVAIFVVIVVGAGYVMLQERNKSIPPPVSQYRTSATGAGDDNTGSAKRSATSSLPQDAGAKSSSSSKVYAVKASTNQSSSFVAGDRISRVVIAPPGKLGIVIDTTLNGPVINKIKDDSPLDGKLFLGDIITDIDGTDTRAMSASSITALMVKSSANERKLTILSKNKLEGETTEGAAATTAVAAAGAAAASTSAADLGDRISRVIVAPPGKLGIVIDTTLNGPVIHQIKAESPMEGKLFLGDIITEIDGTDTRAMSASAITALMVKTSANERKLTILSKNKLEGETTEETSDAAVIVPAAAAVPASTTAATADAAGDVAADAGDAAADAGDAAADAGDAAADVGDAAADAAPETAEAAVAATAAVAAAGTAAAVASSSAKDSDETPAKAAAAAGAEDLITRVVIAPPGKLGIVIDTTSKGPVVHKIKPNSPLEGKLILGDIITEIDGIDSRAMSASAITAMMVKTSANERKLTVLSKKEDLPE